MSCELIKNNILLYLLSLSNTINYIFYFPFILLYLFEIDDLKSIEAIKLYIFFIIYDLIRNTFTNILQKIVNCFGLNRKISLNLIILFLINISLLCIFYRFENKSFLLNVIIIFRILLSLTNISNLFISEIINNIFERKEIYNKLNNFDFYEKINNFLIFLFFFFFINKFNEIYYYFFFSSIFNLFFFIIYFIIFKCHDEKPNSTKEEQEVNKVNNNNNNNTKNQIDEKSVKNIKKSHKQKNIKEIKILGNENPLYKSNNKNNIGNKFKESSIDIKANGNFNNKKFGNMENNININDIDNNDIILSTNNSNQINSKKETNNIDINKKKKEKIDLRKTYQKKNIYILNNTPLTSTNRSFNANLSKNISLAELKNEKVLNTKKLNFLIFILIPSRFLKYLFLFMLFIKTYYLKNIFTIKIHLIFYCCYFFMNILFFHINIKVFAKYTKTKNGKKVLYIPSIILSIPSSITYIYLILDDSFNNKKILLEKYILFFILNFILKECLYFLLRVYYINTISIGFSKKIVKKMKKLSNIFSCFLFLIYNIMLLFIKNDLNSSKIISYFLYYFLPLVLMILFIIYTIIIP